jgi:hypothetical protein
MPLGGNMGDMMKHARKLQEDLARLQSDLKDRVVEGSAGGGVVTAMANGRQELVALKLDKQVIDPGEADMLQDLVLAACNVALAKSRQMVETEMGKLTGGLKLPGMP